MPEPLFKESYRLQTSVCNFIKKETLEQLFSCKFCKISKNTFFTEHLRATASALKDALKKSVLQILQKNNKLIKIWEKLVHLFFGTHLKMAASASASTFATQGSGHWGKEKEGYQSLFFPPLFIGAKKIFLRKIGVNKKSDKIMIWEGRAAEKVMSLTQILLSTFFCNSNLFFLDSHKALIILQQATRKTHSRTYQCIWRNYKLFAQNSTNLSI